MEQQLQYRYTFFDTIHYIVDIDDDMLTVRMFKDVLVNDPNYIPGVDPNTFNLIDSSDHPLLSRHRLELEFSPGDQDVYSVVLGDLIAPELEGKWLKFVGAAQIERTVEGIIARNTTHNFSTEPALSQESLDEGRRINQECIPEYKDCMLWSFDYNFAGHNWHIPYNQFTFTNATKINWNRHDKINQFQTDPQIETVDNNIVKRKPRFWRQRILSLFLFEKTMAFTAASLYCNISMIEGFGVSGDVNLNMLTHTPIMLTDYSTLPIPYVILDGPSLLQPNEVGIIHVTLSTTAASDGITLYDYDTDLYVKTNNGYLAKSKIKLINGKGQFKIRALDLDSNDLMEIKAGFKHFSNWTTKIIKVG